MSKQIRRFQAAQIGHFIKERYLTNNYEDNRIKKKGKDYYGMQNTKVVPFDSDDLGELTKFRSMIIQSGRQINVHEAAKVSEAKIIEEMTSVKMPYYDRLDMRDSINLMKTYYPNSNKDIKVEVWIEIDHANTSKAGDVVGSLIFKY